jgi:hypothetical protein
MPTQTQEILCPAMDLLARASIIEINGYLLHSWQLDAMNGEDDEVVFECSYTDDEGYIFEFAFTEKAMKEASIKGHFLQMMDNEGQLVDIGLYSLKPLDN